MTGANVENPSGEDVTIEVPVPLTFEELSVAALIEEVLFIDEVLLLEEVLFIEALLIDEVREVRTKPSTELRFS